MKLDKAIEILNDLLGEGPQFPPDDRREAVKIGIEALKRHYQIQHEVVPFPEKPLPGETED